MRVTGRTAITTNSYTLSVNGKYIGNIYRECIGNIYIYREYIGNINIYIYIYIYRRRFDHTGGDSTIQEAIRPYRRRFDHTTDYLPGRSNQPYNR